MVFHNKNDNWTLLPFKLTGERLICLSSLECFEVLTDYFWLRIVICQKTFQGILKRDLKSYVVHLGLFKFQQGYFSNCTFSENLFLGHFLSREFLHLQIFSNYSYFVLFRIRVEIFVVFLIFSLVYLWKEQVRTIL